MSKNPTKHPIARFIGSIPKEDLDQMRRAIAADCKTTNEDDTGGLMLTYGTPATNPSEKFYRIARYSVSLPMIFGILIIPLTLITKLDAFVILGILTAYAEAAGIITCVVCTIIYTRNLRRSQALHTLTSQRIILLAALILANLAVGTVLMMIAVGAIENGGYH